MVHLVSGIFRCCDIRILEKSAAGEYIRFVRVLPPINIWTGRGVTEPRVSRHSVWAAAS